MIVDHTRGAPCTHLVRLFHGRGESGVVNNPSIWVLLSDRTETYDAVQSVLQQLRVAGLHMSEMPMRISDAGEET